MQQAEAGAEAPLVSVIIPAYQAGQFIAATLDSVLAQTFQNFEIIVVNDGSPDSEELEKVLEPYLSRILYLRQENQGASAARNTGIREARGEFIAPLDADDLWYPDHLAAQLALFTADSSIDMVYADARIFGDVPEAGRTVMELCPSEGEVTFERLATRQCTAHHCVCLIRREILFRAGLFDPALRRTEDIDMWLRIALQGGRICYQRRVLGQYRRSAGSLSSDPVPMIESFLGVLAKAALFPNLSAAQREAVQRQIQAERIRLEMEKGKSACLAGDAEGAIGHLSRANAQHKSWRVAMVLVLLRVAPGFLQALYQWRTQRVHRLKARP
jgi:hypothetical protein